MDFKIASCFLVVLYATAIPGTTAALDLDNFLSNTHMEVVGIINRKLIMANIASGVSHLNYFHILRALMQVYCVSITLELRLGNMYFIF
jgi:hypothetical protein